MKMELKLNQTNHSDAQLVIVSAFQKALPVKKDKKAEFELLTSHWPAPLKESFAQIKTNTFYKGAIGEITSFNHTDGTQILVIGLGEKAKLTNEKLRKEMAKMTKNISNSCETASLMVDHFLVKNNLENSLYVICEAIGMTDYQFDKHLTVKKTKKLKTLFLDSKAPKSKAHKCEQVLDHAKKQTDSINFGRDLVNEPPNILNSVTYAKRIVEDSKKLHRVKCKVLGVKELKKEKMDMFLSVNAGSAHEAQMVHLTYTPKKVTSKTKHVALVGKGLTFDTGGYSLKPGASMMNMKFDMAGSATVYAAFRAAVLLDADIKITCLMGMTDNAVNEHATMPDSIVKARNGKTVEILNTDAEGRLVLGDVLSYASDLKPDSIIDAATLTGAVLVALGNEVCGLMGNNKKLTQDLLKSADEVSEYMWELPIIDPFREDMKSNIADLKNIGGKAYAGSAKAAAFLENFVGEGIPWAHLDIAGVGDSQSHLPYCPSKGASGSIVRTLTHYLMNQK